MAEGPHVMIPIKELSAVKVRLADVLSMGERRELVLTMLSDVLASVAAADLQAIVLSPDPEVLAFAADHGAEALVESQEASSLNQALEFALESDLGQSNEVIILLADTALVTPEELHMLVDVGRRLARENQDGRAMALATDESGHGTSALYLRPPQAVPPHFGLNSAAQHGAEAKARGIPFEVVRLPGLGLDVDRPADLKALTDQPSRTRTQQYLQTIGFTSRLVD
jgi:2-phospho-L-lactate/phosphoenolpyruvate guanylyltransferase